MAGAAFEVLRKVPAPAHVELLLRPAVGARPVALEGAPVHAQTQEEEHDADHEGGRHEEEMGHRNEGADDTRTPPVYVTTSTSAEDGVSEYPCSSS